MKTNNRQYHKDWTEESPDNFVYAIAAQFTDKLQQTMAERNISAAELSRKLNITPGRMSQILNDPGNLTLKMIVRCARALDMKVGLLAYDDGDPGNQYGPVLSEVFLTCWQHCDEPKTMLDFEKPTSSPPARRATRNGSKALAEGRPAQQLPTA